MLPPQPLNSPLFAAQLQAVPGSQSHSSPGFCDVQAVTLLWWNAAPSLLQQPLRRRGHRDRAVWRPPLDPSSSAGSAHRHTAEQMDGHTGTRQTVRGSYEAPWEGCDHRHRGGKEAQECGQRPPSPGASPLAAPLPRGSSSQAGKAASPGRAGGSGVWHRAQHRGSHRPGTQREACSCPLSGNRGQQAGGGQPRDTLHPPSLEHIVHSPIKAPWGLLVRVEAWPQAAGKDRPMLPHLAPTGPPRVSPG